eukprot:Awhi_evm1s1943
MFNLCILKVSYTKFLPIFPIVFSTDFSTDSLSRTKRSLMDSAYIPNPHALDTVSLQNIALSAYTYDYHEEGTDVIEASKKNIGFESTVLPFLKMAGTGLRKQTTPKYSKFEYTYDWIYKRSIDSNYKVWLMIDGNFHPSDKEGVSFGGNTQGEVDVWVDALMLLLVDTPWGTYKWPEGKTTPPAAMPGLMGFHFDMEPLKKDTPQYNEIVNDFVNVATMVNYKGRIGAILPGAAQQSEFSQLTKKNKVKKDFDWTMQQYTEKALLTIQRYSPNKVKNGQIPITEALFWRLAPWPLRSHGYEKQPASMTHVGN